MSAEDLSCLEVARGGRGNIGCVGNMRGNVTLGVNDNIGTLAPPHDALTVVNQDNLSVRRGILFASHDTGEWLFLTNIINSEFLRTTRE